MVSINTKSRHPPFAVLSLFLCHTLTEVIGVHYSARQANKKRKRGKRGVDGWGGVDPICQVWTIASSLIQDLQPWPGLYHGPRPLF